MKPIRVLHLIECYLPPSQVWLYLLLRATRREIQHHIGVREFLPENFYEPEFSYHKTRLGQYHRAIKQLAGSWWRKKWNHLLLYGQRLHWLSEEREWKKYLLEHEIDVIHVHFGPYATEQLPFLKESGVPFAVSFYGYDYEKAPFQKPSLIAKYKELFAHAAAIICEGEHGCQILRQRYNCPEEKLKVVPLGIQIENWPSPVRQVPGNAGLKLLQIADFTPKKGQLDTIEAAHLARQSQPNLTLHLVGKARDEHYWRACQERITALEATDWIKCTDFVPFQQLPQLLAQHDVFIHPSRYTADRDCEGGAPTILFYAQCMGLPVISTLHCDIPAVVQHEVSGLLVGEGNVASLAEAMSFFASLSVEGWREWQEKTINWGRTVSNIERGASSLREVYNEVASIWKK